MKKISKKLTVSGIVSAFIICMMSALTVYASSITPVTGRIEVEHPGTVGYDYSSLHAVNTSIYDSTRFYWTASVENEPTDISSTQTAVEWKIYKNNTLFSSVGSKTGFEVGNTESYGTVITLLGSGQKPYGKLNNMYKMYINVSLCPPAYYYYTTLNFGGVFYGYNN